MRKPVGSLQVQTHAQPYLRGDPKIGRNTETASKNKAPENPKPSLDMTGKLGKDGKLTPQEHQCHVDNSPCLFCR